MFGIMRRLLALLERVSQRWHVGTSASTGREGIAAVWTRRPLRSWVGALGIGGTLAASVLTQLFSRRAERERRLAEDQTRWLPNRLAIATDLLSQAGHVYRTLYGAAAFLNAPDGTIHDRPQWLAGHMNVLSTPEEGLPGIFPRRTVRCWSTFR